MVIDSPIGDPIRTPTGAVDLTAPELFVFDFDGTLVDQRGGWLLLQELFGTRAAGKELSQQYRNGELSFQEWCEQNVALWADRGVRQSHIAAAADAVKLTRGAENLLRLLDESSRPYGTISGGVLNLQRVLDPYDPEFRLANELQFQDGCPSGAVARVGPNNKDDVLESVCAEYDVAMDDVFYVGDSHTDVEAFAIAGTSVVFDPDDRLNDAVVEQGDLVVEERDLGHLTSLLRPLLE